MAVSDNNSANEGIVAREGAVVVGVFVPCYGFLILEFWMEHKNLMLRTSDFSTTLAKEVPAKIEPIFEGSFAVCPTFFEVPVEGGTKFQQFQTTIPGIPLKFWRIP